MAGLHDRRIDPVAFAADHPRLYSFLYNKWYFDEVYDAGSCCRCDVRDVPLDVVDVQIIDGLMGIARAVDVSSASGCARVQTGLVANYALAIALGMVVIVGVYFAAFSDLFR